jgi:AcrR family transcriptional regulator
MKMTSVLFMEGKMTPAPAPALPDRPVRSFPQFLATQSEGRPKGERTRAQLQIAACAILRDSGPEGLTIAGICEGAGVSNGTFYIYFPDRHVLLDTLLTAFVSFLQLSMRGASGRGLRDAPRAATRAYLDLFAQNSGLMRCLVQPLDGFPEAQAAFQRLNREWIDTVVASVERRQRQEGGADPIPRAELLRRAYALGGMVDQYLSNLLLSKDPNLAEISQDREAVLDTLSLIWERGMSR